MALGAWHSSSSLPQLLLHLLLGHSSFVGMNMGEFLSLPQCSHTCPHPLPGRMQLPGSPKAAPSLPALMEPSFFPDTDSPLLWQSQACSPAATHPSFSSSLPVLLTLLFFPGDWAAPGGPGRAAAIPSTAC